MLVSGINKAECANPRKNSKHSPLIDDEGKCERREKTKCGIRDEPQQMQI
jgi:hypothetical protein